MNAPALTEQRPEPVRKSPSRYTDLFAPFNDEELALIMQLKRFFECCEGDAKLRHSVQSGEITREQRELMREIGIGFDLDELSLLWERPDFYETLLLKIPCVEHLDALPEDLIGPIKAYPLLHLWARFSFTRAWLYGKQKEYVVAMGSTDALFDAWRQRRIRATRSELGSYGYSIDHPLLAIELAVGCSVRCSFCAFDAPQLQKVLDWEDPASRELFRGVSRSLYQVFGHSAGHALLYWSTEPNDNPHYIDFMRDYGDITGSTVCTATARSDRDWIRSLINHYRQGPVPWPRISVLSKGAMYRLYRQFTPEAFRDLSLLMQQKDSEEYRVKVPGGREKMLARLDEYGDLRDKEGDDGDTFVPQGSIACVSGLLINLVERTLKLISPCYTNRQYRYGYRVFAQATFEDAEDFDRVLRAMLARKLVSAPYRDMPMAFRDDLRYQARDDGFMLVSPNRVHRFRGNEVFAPLGELLARGDLTYAEVCDALIDEHRCNPMHVVAVLKSLFDKGLLDELGVEAQTPRPLPGSGVAVSPAQATAG
jgi:radical SAM family RiPP maturation amino acid epimerase